MNTGRSKWCKITDQADCGRHLATAAPPKKGRNSTACKTRLQCHTWTYYQPMKTKFQTTLEQRCGYQQKCVQSSGYYGAASNQNFKPVHVGWPKNVNHYQIIKKLYLIVLKLVSEIRIIWKKLMYESSTIILPVDIKYSVCDLLCDVNNYAWPRK